MTRKDVSADYYKKAMEAIEELGDVSIYEDHTTIKQGALEILKYISLLHGMLGLDVPQLPHEAYIAEVNARQVSK